MRQFDIPLALVQVRTRLEKMKAVVLLLSAMASSAQSITFGSLNCNNNCGSAGKYGDIVGTTGASSNPNLGVFGTRLNCNEQKWKIFH